MSMAWQEGPMESGGGTEVRLAHRKQVARWEVRAAQWKALELARAAFGEDASFRSAPYPARGAFRGMVRLQVPFQDLEEHRRREARFCGWAANEPVLQSVPLVFVFDPVPCRLRTGRGS